MKASHRLAGMYELILWCVAARVAAWYWQASCELPAQIGSVSLVVPCREGLGQAVWTGHQENDERQKHWKRVQGCQPPGLQIRTGRLLFADFSASLRTTYFLKKKKKKKTMTLAVERDRIFRQKYWLLQKLTEASTSSELMPLKLPQGQSRLHIGTLADHRLLLEHGIRPPFKSAYKLSKTQRADQCVYFRNNTEEYGRLTALRLNGCYG